MKFSKYTLMARIFPAIITALPLIILSGFIISQEYIDLFQNLKYIKVAGSVSVPIILLFLFAHLNRFIAKEYFQKKYFKEELEMPTTTFLLFADNSLSNNYKSNIRGKIENEFSIKLPTVIDEESHIENTRLRISESIGMVRNKVGDGNLLLQHNIEYGFARNLIGGSIISLLSSVISIFVYLFWIPSVPALITNIILSVFYIVILVLSRYLIEKYGVIYAKRLFQEYMSS